MARALSLLSLALVVALAGNLAPADARGGRRSHAARHDLQGSMRRLWTDHVVWTRQFVVSELADLPDLGAATSRLLQNQVDIGDAIKPFFGAAAGDALTTLLQEHITTAAALVAALEDGDTAAADAASAAWRQNADEIAQFLADANPRAWPFEEMRAMMHEHLDLTTDEVAARLAMDWAADVDAFDAILTQALEMADMLSDGLLRRGARR